MYRFQLSVFDTLDAHLIYSNNFYMNIEVTQLNGYLIIIEHESAEML